MEQFEYTPLPARIVFGRGTLERTAEEVRRLRRSRVLLLAGPGLAAISDRVEQVLGELCVGRFDGATAHTPVAVTEEALHELRRVEADCVVAVGGPTSPAEIGMPTDGLDHAAELATSSRYPNPAPVTRDGVRALLDRAMHGVRPLVVPR